MLRSVRGFYVTYDRNYSYLGVRGFSRPGDYNARVLLLVDGHRLNDNVFGSALIGSEFPLDVELIERVEIIRGPSSSLYGTSAFFAVINVITRDTPQVRGTEIAGALGSFDDGAGASQLRSPVHERRERRPLGHGRTTARGRSTSSIQEFDSPDDQQRHRRARRPRRSPRSCSATASYRELPAAGAVRDARQAGADRIVRDGLRRSANRHDRNAGLRRPSYQRDLRADGTLASRGLLRSLWLRRRLRVRQRRGRSAADHRQQGLRPGRLVGRRADGQPAYRRSAHEWRWARSSATTSARINTTTTWKPDCSTSTIGGSRRTGRSSCRTSSRLARSSC